MEEVTITGDAVPVRGCSLEFDASLEKELIEDAKKDPEAFGRLYDRYYDRIYFYVLRRTADKTTAEDITADTFFIALKKLWMFKWQNVPFSAWLYKIATNEVSRYYRKQSKRKSIDIDDYADTLSSGEIDADAEYKANEEEIERLNLFIKLHKEISALKPHYQEVIVLRYFEQMSIKDICLVLGKVEGTVKSLIHRALNKLSERLDESVINEVINGS